MPPNRGGGYYHLKDVSLSSSLSNVCGCVRVFLCTFIRMHRGHHQLAALVANHFVLGMGTLTLSSSRCADLCTPGHLPSPPP